MIKNGVIKVRPGIYKWVYDKSTREERINSSNQFVSVDLIPLAPKRNPQLVRVGDGGKLHHILRWYDIVNYQRKRKQQIRASEETVLRRISDYRIKHLSDLEFQTYPAAYRNMSVDNKEEMRQKYHKMLRGELEWKANKKFYELVIRGIYRASAGDCVRAKDFAKQGFDVDGNAIKLSTGGEVRLIGGGDYNINTTNGGKPGGNIIQQLLEIYKQGATTDLAATKQQFEMNMLYNQAPDDFDNLILAEIEDMKTESDRLSRKYETIRKESEDLENLENQLDESENEDMEEKRYQIRTKLDEIGEQSSKIDQAIINLQSILEEFQTFKYEQESKKSDLQVPPIPDSDEEKKGYDVTRDQIVLINRLNEIKETLKELIDGNNLVEYDDVTQERWNNTIDVAIEDPDNTNRMRNTIREFEGIIDTIERQIAAVQETPTGDQKFDSPDEMYASDAPSDVDSVLMYASDAPSDVESADMFASDTTSDAGTADMFASDTPSDVESVQLYASDAPSDVESAEMVATSDMFASDTTSSADSAQMYASTSETDISTDELGWVSSASSSKHMYVSSSDQGEDLMAMTMNM